MNQENNALAHYGVKGMKWGVRRNKGRGYSKNTSGWSKDAKRVNAIKKKSISQMSNEELRTVNKRLQLEQEYNRLNPSNVQKGLNFIKGAASLTGTAVGFYNNSNTLVKAGKTVLEFYKNR